MSRVFQVQTTCRFEVEDLAKQIPGFTLGWARLSCPFGFGAGPSGHMAAPNSAIARYVNEKKVPQLFISAGTDKWSDYQHFPWTMRFQPSFRTEGQIYANILKEKPDAKIAILYQDDDLGKDYLAGMRDVMGDKFDKIVVTASYDPTVDSQIISLQAAGANVLLAATTTKFAVQAIRKVHDLDWKPLFLMSNVSASVGAVLKPAGPENAIGIITDAYLKDSTDRTWKNDAGMNEWRDFIAKYMPGADTSDGSYVFAYTLSKAYQSTGASRTSSRRLGHLHG